MAIEFSSQFICDNKISYIIPLIHEFVKNRKGKILHISNNNINIKFGSMLMARLFGIVLLSMFSSIQLPCIVTIKLTENNNTSVIFEFADNLGNFVYRDSFCRREYQKYFQILLEDFKQRCL